MHFHHSLMEMSSSCASNRKACVWLTAIGAALIFFYYHWSFLGVHTNDSNDITHLKLSL